jgi:hypothetical protein
VRKQSESLLLTTSTWKVPVPAEAVPATACSEILLLVNRVWVLIQAIVIALAGWHILLFISSVFVFLNDTQLTFTATCKH